MSGTDTEPPRPSAPHTLTGQVTRHDGTPARGAVVTVALRRLRSETVAGQATTGPDGTYSLSYPAPDTPADLVVRATWTGPGGAEPTAELLRPAPGRRERVHLTLPSDGTTEHARLVAELTPLLDGLDLTDLSRDGDRDDLGFLARATGRSHAQVGHAATAARHAAATALPAEYFYGLLRFGLPPALSALARTSPADLRAALLACADAGVTGTAEPAAVDTFVDALRDQEVAAVATPGPASTTPVAELFALAVPEAARRAEIYRAYLDRTDATDFWAALPDAERDRLRLALHLGSATGANLPLVATVLDRFDTGDLTRPADLARISGTDWAALAAETGVPETLRTTLAASRESAGADFDVTGQYGELVAGLVAQAHPTAHLAHGLATESADSPAARFLTDHPDFDLTTTRVDAVTVTDEAARQELAGIQRLAVLSPRYDSVKALRDEGYDSAYAVAKAGRDTFVRQLAPALGAERAEAVHTRAAQVHGASTTLIADLRTAAHFDPPWLASPRVDAELVAQVPDWEELFGSPDYCACSDCRSVHGQAAYFVDLMLSLRDIGIPGDPEPPGGEGHVANSLYRRRPDLWDIQLTCDNTNIQLPYADLVSELLEDAVSPTHIPAAQRQTSGDPAQLRAQPQHVNTGAYDVLRAAVYPFGLPFDLWGEQTRVSLAHLGVRRHQLMAALRPATATGTPVAVERVGLPPVGGRIITGEPLDPGRTLAEFYGRPATTAPEALVDDLTNVRRMLEAAGLVYAELVAVLDTRFVNPRGEIRIGGGDGGSQCDTNNLYLWGLDPAALDRLHRFVRLWRALGRPVLDVDHVLMSANNQGRLDATTLRSTVATDRLAERLRLTHEQVLVFYGPLPTHHYATADLPPLYDRLFLDPTVVQLEPGQVSPFALNAARTELAVIGDLRDPAVTSALLAVLEVTDAELAELVTGPRSVTPSRLLTLANLSALYRTVVLARALDMSLADLLRLIELYGGGGPFPLPPDQFSGGEPELRSGLLMRHPAHSVLPVPGGGDEPELVTGRLLTRPGHPDAPVAALPPVDVLVVVTERFLDAVDALTARGFTVPEVDAVLTSSVPDREGPIPDDDAQSATLTALRAALQAVYEQTARTGDEKGELTKKHLALLGWDTALVQEAVSTLLGTVQYTVSVDAVPDGMYDLTGMSVRYDAETRLLVFTGPMTNAERDTLTRLPGGPAGWPAAVETLHRAPRTFTATRMKALRPPLYSVPLDAEPPTLKLPARLSGTVFYDVTRRALCSRAYLSPDDLDAVAAAWDDDAHRAAVEELARVQDDPPAAGDVFLTDVDRKTLFDVRTSPAARFRLVLERLNPYLRRTLSETTVKQHIGQAAGLDAASADVLLGTWLRSPSKPSALQDFLAPRFVGSDPAVAVAAPGFPEQFTTLTLVHRVALVLARLAVTAEEIPWIFGYAASAGWLDLNTLPTRVLPGPSPLFPRFVRLLGLARLRDRIPGHARTLREVFTAARVPGGRAADVVAELARQTRWDRADLDVLTGEGLLGLTAPADFYGEEGLLELLAALTLVQRLGVSAERAAAWLPAELDAAAAQSAWQAAKARHSLRDWPAAGGSLRDRLREKQRAALIGRLIADPRRDGAGLPYWHDTNTLFDYFLIDVEMGPAQLTTRVAQAIFSVQLYIQRIQLNLEDLYIHPNAEYWKRWEWMKAYRVWEANQKVFLYPENYFEPELRLGKSPQFAELENELMQKEVTEANVEKAFLHYLEKLDDIAHLRPIGSYRHIRSDGETVYVFARTDASPGNYHFRRWENRTTWSPWEKVDLDLDTDMIVPIVWNGHLYLFWPSFTEQQVNAPFKIEEGAEMPEEPLTYWKIQLNWSRYADGGWEAKKIADGELQTDIKMGTNVAANIDRYVLAPEIDAESGDLLLWMVYSDTGYHPDPTYHRSGHFRLSLRRNSVYIHPIQLQPRENYTGPPPAIDTNFTDVYFNERVEEEIVPGVAWSHMSVFDPTSNPRDPRSIYLFQATPGLHLYRQYESYQYRDPAQRYLQYFTDGTRTYLMEGHDVPGPLALDSGARAGAGQPAAGGPADDDPLGAGPFAAELDTVVKFRFLPLYHPHTNAFLYEYARNGLSGVYERNLQLHPDRWTGPFDFGADTMYKPHTGERDRIVRPYPGEPVEFALGDSYAEYNWELFFHVPLLIAERLSANQRFDDALKWFHRIFDPTNRDYDVDRPQRFWITKPFFEATSDTYYDQRIEQILERTALGEEDTLKAVRNWLRNPFQPDVVARTRTTAYQKAVVMKYLDNLIAWADQLFRQDTLETINQATQLYVLAAELLGRRPEEVTRPAPAPRTYRQLLNPDRPVTDAVVAVENLLAGTTGTAGTAGTAGTDMTPYVLPGVNLNWLYYFCLPRNDKLAGYWDTVSDRLFKIRNSLDIDGVLRATALFGPPIDPSLLVRATAAGVDLGQVLDDIGAPLPHYRFDTMAAKAKELAGEVKEFGARLLEALEKRDTEALARMRAGHEVAVLDAAREVRRQQVKEATEAYNGALRSKAAAEHRREYYTSREFMNASETSHADLSGTAKTLQYIAAGFQGAAAITSLFPDAKVGSPFTVGLQFGGNNLTSALNSLAGSLGSLIGALSTQGSVAQTLGGYQRRADDWTFQAEQARLDSAQFDKQIAAAGIRQAIAERELANHERQREQAAQVADFLKDKFTSTELYDWMAGQLSTTYFQAYQLAYDVAKRAERSWRHELGVTDSEFITFGYWDSLHRGLLAGERLAADLSRMDAAYLDANARELELTKRVSLAQLDPNALLRLKETGRCYVSLPEAVFDLDGPGHYQRRIKTLTLTVPCVAGPYTSVNLTARLLHSSVRVDPQIAEGEAYGRDKEADPRFRDHTGPVQSVVTSTGQDDGGLFETNLNDPRYLPFEGAGAISEWQLELPVEFRQFDYASITDVVFQLRYTARDGGPALAAAAEHDLRDALGRWVHAGGGKGLFRTFSARREYADRWSRFLAPAGAGPATLEFALTKDRFPYLFRDFGITVGKAELVLVLSREAAPGTDTPYLRFFRNPLPVAVTTSSGGGTDAELAAAPALDGQPHARLTGVTLRVRDDTTLTVTVAREAILALPEQLRTGDRLDPDAVTDLLLVCPYGLTEAPPTPE
ncbi:neuraminidase-like domain-containing protein [Streptomyces sp. NPDC088387]|uniref:Tc toxin subunit A-related protein n=1 Tax=Streptomyces sp. NPDC088387 TaxID=3365859 RepID=UPI0037FBB441